MNKQDFDQLLEEIQQQERQVRNDGQREYAHDDSNVFANFDRVATHLGLSREQVLIVYALKHWDGITAYIKGHRSQREDIRGRIKDLRLYLALLWGMVEDEDRQDIDFSTYVGPVDSDTDIDNLLPNHEPKIS